MTTLPQPNSLRTMMAELVKLEHEVSAAAAALDPADEMRVYPWRPMNVPELPAIWNWIDDGSFEIADTARVDDVIVVRTTVAIRPGGSLEESMDRLLRLVDVYRDVVDRALWTNQRPRARVLNGTAVRAKRVLTRTAYDEFNDLAVMTMDMLLEIQLSKIVQPTAPA